MVEILTPREFSEKLKPEKIEEGIYQVKHIPYSFVAPSEKRKAPLSEVFSKVQFFIPLFSGKSAKIKELKRMREIIDTSSVLEASRKAMRGEYPAIKSKIDYHKELVKPMSKLYTARTYIETTETFDEKALKKIYQPVREALEKSNLNLKFESARIAIENSIVEAFRRKAPIIKKFKDYFIRVEFRPITEDFEIRVNDLKGKTLFTKIVPFALSPSKAAMRIVRGHHDVSFEAETVDRDVELNVKDATTNEIITSTKIPFARIREFFDIKLPIGRRIIDLEIDIKQYGDNEAEIIIKDKVTNKVILRKIVPLTIVKNLFHFEFPGFVREEKNKLLELLGMK